MQLAKNSPAFGSFLSHERSLLKVEYSSIQSFSDPCTLVVNYAHTWDLRFFGAKGNHVEFWGRRHNLPLLGKEGASRL